ncbi:DMT family transporter [Pyxidicoccus sp. QH1ED-7-1]|nr:DMT family transporter [Pyxidicoccus xibeiensis]
MAYAEGGSLSRELGGWRVLSWALVLSAPVLLPVVVLSADARVLDASPRAWAALAYLSGVSMFLGCLAWYRALALAGVARVSQLQLLQPLLSLGWSVLLLGEQVGRGTLGAALLVVGCVLASARSRIQRLPAPEAPAVRPP